MVFKFLQVNVTDEEVDPFVNRIEEVLKEFAGNAYHFRYEVDQSFGGGLLGNPGSNLNFNRVHKHPKFDLP